MITKRHIRARYLIWRWCEENRNPCRIYKSSGGFCLKVLFAHVKSFPMLRKVAIVTLAILLFLPYLGGAFELSQGKNIDAGCSSNPREANQCNPLASECLFCLSSCVMGLYLNQKLSPNEPSTSSSILFIGFESLPPEGFVGSIFRPPRSKA